MRPITRNRILKYYKNQCASCGIDFSHIKTIEFHHIIPLYIGGRDDENNIEPLCSSCHKKKHKTYGKDFTSLDKYFRIGISPEYIEISKKISELHLWKNSKLVSQVLDHYLKLNDIHFGLQ